MLPIHEILTKSFFVVLSPEGAEVAMPPARPLALHVDARVE
jgi:hypothetical protein